MDDHIFRITSQTCNLKWFHTFQVFIECNDQQYIYNHKLYHSMIIITYDIYI